MESFYWTSNVCRVAFILALSAQLTINSHTYKQAHLSALFGMFGMRCNRCQHSQARYSRTVRLLGNKLYVGRREFTIHGKHHIDNIFLGIAPPKKLPQFMNNPLAWKLLAIHRCCFCLARNWLTKNIFRRVRWRQIDVPTSHNRFNHHYGVSGNMTRGRRKKEM